MTLFSGNNIGIFIHQIDLALCNYAKNELAPFKVAPEQCLIMELLWKEDGLTQKEISQKLDKDKAIITRMLDSLEQKRFIRRIISQGDRRLQNVYLTAEGKKLMDNVVPTSEEINRLICQGISPEELQEVTRILSKMRQNIQQT
ncbi:MarR family winged helix-turn-helix transcriptional regulator [Cohnella suwonensis]|uniref:MarR family winged helix-turn-helix transcriptional regulator n=1 Tax=Cohnella suwonensis TaxID=696072 RepID=A0ABW0LYV9_9BACL